jgi:sugar phosphate isomerase/epimerase
MDGSHPGTGTYDFAPLFAMLKKLNYRRWVSVEAFDFSIGADAIAQRSIATMRKAAEASYKA